MLKPLSCFDVSCDGRFLVAGTDVIKDDAFLLFWDIRSTNLLGGYWDTHQGDITQVKIVFYIISTVEPHLSEIMLGKGHTD